MTPGPLRVGDAERLAAANRLAAHTAAGRLTLAEYDQRASATWAARTGADLDALFADLPAPVAERRPAARLPTRTGVVLSVLVVTVVLVAWLAALAHPAWASAMMTGCM
jgi:hypothetical protein